jgi:hypothetical protein
MASSEIAPSYLRIIIDSIWIEIGVFSSEGLDAYPVGIDRLVVKGTGLPGIDFDELIPVELSG